MRQMIDRAILSVKLISINPIFICVWTTSRVHSIKQIPSIHGKNDFAEGFEILLDTDLKIILLDHQNNFVGTLKKKVMLQKILMF